jgi:hypothetical protein
VHAAAATAAASVFLTMVPPVSWLWCPGPESNRHDVAAKAF